MLRWELPIDAVKVRGSRLELPLIGRDLSANLSNDAYQMLADTVLSFTDSNGVVTASGWR